MVESRSSQRAGGGEDEAHYAAAASVAAVVVVFVGPRGQSTQDGAETMQLCAVPVAEASVIRCCEPLNLEQAAMRTGGVLASRVEMKANEPSWCDRLRR